MVNTRPCRTTRWDPSIALGRVLLVATVAFLAAGCATAMPPAEVRYQPVVGGVTRSEIPAGVRGAIVQVDVFADARRNKDVLGGPPCCPLRVATPPAETFQDAVRSELERLGARVQSSRADFRVSGTLRSFALTIDHTQRKFLGDWVGSASLELALYASGDRVPLWSGTLSSVVKLPRTKTSPSVDAAAPEVLSRALSEVVSQIGRQPRLLQALSGGAERREAGVARREAGVARREAIVPRRETVGPRRESAPLDLIRRPAAPAAETSAPSVMPLPQTPASSVPPLTASPAPGASVAPLPATVNPSPRAAAVTVAPLSAAPALGRFHALVIGNQAYRNLRPLKTAIADAEAVAETLRTDFAFADVVVLRDATRADMVRALDDMRRVLGDQDNLLIYYSGHGVIDGDAGRGYWLPVDADATSTAAWLSNSDVTDKLRALRARHVLVVADSCFSGTVSRDVTIRPSGPPDIDRLAAKRARTVITSGSLEPIADLSGGTHSLFTRAFLDALREVRSVTDATTLFGAVERQVRLNADQTPQYSIVRQAGHDDGDFLFAPSR